MADSKNQAHEQSIHPPWYKEAVIYELHVKAFCDGDGDGVGDFKGLCAKLDYLKELGITAVWLLPFTASPMRDDGYDTSDYRKIHSTYGTMRDFKQVVREAHKRDLKVITELVLNHTSDQHPWFQRARRAAPGTGHRDFYVWSDHPHNYSETRIIFQDFETSNWTWDPVAGAYYWHRFYSHQPDLNYDNPAVRKEMFKVIDFWLKAGVDGLRLDAVPYLYEREGTNCENLPETHSFLKRLRRYVDERFEDRMLLAEANQWPEDAAAYFGEGDECHMAFHFPVMPRLFMALRMEDRFPVIDIMEQTPEIPDSCQWAMFLRNHDELTLEMVTDEERDFMYRAYAHDPQMRINLGIRRRLAPLMENRRKRIELMLGLLFSLPGTPVLYYGDEIGMGDNVYLGDRDGVRTPMQWNVDRNAGFSSATPQSLYLPVIIDPEYHYHAVNVEAQQRNASSLMWWTRRLIALRRSHRALGLGKLTFLDCSNNKILAFFREHEEERVLVVINLSRFTQFADLDLSMFQGMTPIEMFGRTDFPVIGEQPYFFTISPHSFYWFELRTGDRPLRRAESEPDEAGLPVIYVERTWREAFRPDALPRLVPLLARWLPYQRWFGDKARRIKNIRIMESIPLPAKRPTTHILPVEVSFTDGDPRIYVSAFTLLDKANAGEHLEQSRVQVLARVRSGRDRTVGYLADAMLTPDFPRWLLGACARRQAFETAGGRVLFQPEPGFSRIRESAGGDLEPKPIKGEQSNSSVLFGERLVLKLFRRLEPGINPDQEIGHVLTREGFEHTPPLAAAFEYHPRHREPMSLGLVHGFVSNQGDAWDYTQGALADYFERALAHPEDIPFEAAPNERLLETAARSPEEEEAFIIGPFLESARLLGNCTARMHIALAGVRDRADFAPEIFTSLYKRSLYQSMRNLTGRVFRTLARKTAGLPEEEQALADPLIRRKNDLLERFRDVLSLEDPGLKLRIHGDYHLGQVLYTGGDFIIIDFEGEPARPLSERRKKYSPLRDVAGMHRSFHYAAYAGLHRQQAVGMTQGLEKGKGAVLAEFWCRWVSAAFLKEYLAVAADGGFLPASADLGMLLEIFLLEKAVYELGYELNNRPNWVAIPLRGLTRLLEDRERTDPE
ncbi:MAG: maltose alpha-D-glucosyltransferase [Thermodesulfobacteriota bacterium]